MKDIAKTSRVYTALQVIRHMNDGMTVVSACKEVGIPRSTFYDVVKKNPEAVTEYHEIVEANYPSAWFDIISQDRDTSEGHRGWVIRRYSPKRTISNLQSVERARNKLDRCSKN